MHPSRRILLAAFGLGWITLMGAAGYVLVEGWSWADALYMTVITITTVGYDEVVVIESDPGKESELTSAGIHSVIGSAVSDEVLTAAGVKHARAVVIATSSDSDNVFITLAARELNPNVRVHARAESEAAIRRLYRAGADHVTSPFQMGGMRAAASILRPSVVDFLELSTALPDEAIDLEEIRIEEGSSISGAELAEVEKVHGRLRIVAVRRADETFQIISDKQARVGPGDHLVMIGERAHLDSLAQDAATSVE
jgi:voltage-gated potassium channel